jgi:hypothetical protein
MAKRFHRQQRYGSVFCLLIICSSVSCTTAVDRIDAASVASAFVSALSDSQVEQASQFVNADERGDFLNDVNRNLPEIPADFDVVVKANGDRAAVSNNDSGSFRINLIRRDGQWWVTK